MLWWRAGLLLARIEGDRAGDEVLGVPAAAGAQRIAAELGLMLVAPDTSPRGANLPGESDEWDFRVRTHRRADALPLGEKGVQGLSR